MTDSAMGDSRFLSLLRDFKQSTGLQDGGEDLPDGQLFLIDDSFELAVLFNDKTDTVRLSSPIGELRGDEPPELLRFLLDANLFWAGANGATISLDDATGRVFLQDRRPLEGLDVAAFNEWMSGFVNAVEKWSLALAGRQADSAPDQEEQLPSFKV